MPLPILMADSTNPLAIPERFRARDNGVAIYHDGPHRWPPAIAATWPRCWRISVEGDPQLALEARVLDVETLDVPPAAVTPYQVARARHDKRTTIYCDRSTAASVIAAVPDWRELDWWIAAWETPAPTQAALAWDLSAHWDAPIAAERIVACQYLTTTGYDQSVVYTDPRWAKG